MDMTIPVFPCKSLGETLTFYQTFGFEITHHQETPYLYGAIQRGNTILHFSSLTIWHSKNAVCLVMVVGVERDYQAFSDALRTRLGKIPTYGLPRITRFRKGQTRFQVFDPNGNTLIYIDQSESNGGYHWSENTLSDVETTLQNAAFLRDTYCKDEAAAKILDKALVQNQSITPIDRARMLAMRAELAVAMGDTVRTQILRSELAQISLSEEERVRFGDELHAADELEQWLTHKV